MRNIASTIANVEIGRRLASLREQFRLSQSDFAAKLSVSLRAYQGYERGEREVSAAIIRSLYEVFRVQPVWLLLGGDDPIRERGEIDPMLMGAIGAEVNDVVRESQDKSFARFAPWVDIGYSMALVYNRVIRQIKPGENFGNAVTAEVSYLKELAVHESKSGNPPKMHPEELRHLDSVGALAHEVLGDASKKMDLRREVSVTVDGKKHHGHYIIKGKRRLGVVVYYDGRSLTDEHNYRPDQLSMMEGIAHQLLWEMVTGKTISSKKVGDTKRSTVPARRPRPRASR